MSITMLVIRQEQMEKFQTDSLERFVLSAIVRLRTEFEGALKSESDEDLESLIRDGLQRAEGYGITGESDVECFIECMVRYGLNFDSNPHLAWARRILDDSGLYPFEKMDRIADHETFAMELIDG